MSSRSDRELPVLLSTASARPRREARAPARRRAAGAAERAQGIAVVRIIARLNVGGPALHTIHLATGLQQQWPTLLVAGEVGPEEADLFEEARRRGARVKRLAELGRRIRPLQDVLALVRLYGLLRREKPLVVHTHTAKAGLLGRLAAWAARVPVRVHTFHGHVFEGGYFGPIATRVFVALERMLSRLSTAVVTVSEGQAEALVRRYRICPAGRMHVVPLGLDLEPFAPVRSEAAGADFRAEIGAGGRQIVTIVGRLTSVKNHDLFLEAARRVQDRRPCVFVLVGGGEEEEALRSQAERLGVSDSVRFLGWRSDLPGIYAGSDVVVLSSRNEGTPVALIEALAAGRPVVATEVGGVKEVLDGGRLGRLVPPEDPDALAEAIVETLERPLDGGRAAAISGEVRSRYAVERLLEDIDGLYHQLLRSAVGEQLAGAAGVRA